MIVNEKLIYSERVSSKSTLALFLALTILFLSLLVWRLLADGLGVLAVVFLCLGGVFLFYSLNYRTLVIRLDPRSLQLTFGVFTWTVPLDNIAECRPDDIPWLKKMGGAGIHFMNVRRRYRVSLNFLEHPRVVIALKRKRGLVRDISFSTRKPDEILRLIRESVAAIAVSKGNGDTGRETV